MIGPTLLHAAPGGGYRLRASCAWPRRPGRDLPAFLDQSLAALEIGVAN